MVPPALLLTAATMCFDPPSASTTVEPAQPNAGPHTPSPAPTEQAEGPVLTAEQAERERKTSLVLIGVGGGLMGVSALAFGSMVLLIVAAERSRELASDPENASEFLGGVFGQSFSIIGAAAAGIGGGALLIAGVTTLSIGLAKRGRLRSQSVSRIRPGFGADRYSAHLSLALSF